MADLRFLGGAVLEGGEGPLRGPASRRHPVATLALLATAPSRTLSRAKLVGLLWPDVDEATGRNRLTSCLYHLRRALGGSAIASVGDGLRLDRGEIDCDVWRFEDALADDDLAAAVRLYGGSFLDGFYLDDSSLFEERVDRERRRLQRSWRDAVETLATRAEARGDAGSAVRWWRERVAEDPFDSRAAARLIAALASAGRRGEALRAAETHSERLRDELGAEPDADFLALVARVRTPDPSRRESEPLPGAEGGTRAPGRAREEDRRAIAVLPFETLGGAGDTGFGEGVHGGILTRLAELPELTVIARTSVLRYRDTRRRISDIAMDLGVDWVLEGDVQESAGRFRVRVRLVEAATDRQVWALDRSGSLSAADVFELQADVTNEIVEHLHLELTPEERKQVRRTPTESLEAYRLCAQGRMLLDRRSREEMERAVACFERALALDPAYPVARVGLADALGLLHAYGHAEADRVLPRAEAAIREALEADPRSAEAHAALGRLLGQRNEARAADAEMRLAIELKPSYAEAHNWDSVGSQVLGRPERALESARRAVRLNPLSPEAVANLAFSYLINRELEPALAEARRTLELVPSYESGRFFEGIVLHEMGRFEEAAETLDGLIVPWAESAPPAVRALALVGSGEGDAAREILAELETGGRLFDAGLVRAALGETGAAFDAFARAELGGLDFASSNWPTLVVRYLFPDVWSGLRNDPRYEALRRRIDGIWGLDAGA